VAPQDFNIHDTDKAMGGLMLLHFGLVFSVGPSLWKFFGRRPCTFTPFIDKQSQGRSQPGQEGEDPPENNSSLPWRNQAN